MSIIESKSLRYIICDGCNIAKGYENKSLRYSLVDNLHSNTLDFCSEECIIMWLYRTIKVRELSDKLDSLKEVLDNVTKGKQ